VVELENEVKSLSEQLSKIESNNQFLNDKTVSASEKMESIMQELSTLKKERQTHLQTIREGEGEAEKLKQTIAKYQTYDGFIVNIEKFGKRRKLIQ
jgi:chromosome segregation ATPase